MSEEVIDAGQETLMSVWQIANTRGWLTLTGLDPEALNDATADDEDKIVLFVSGMGDSAAWARGDFALHVRTKIRKQQKRENWSQTRYNEVWAQELERLSRRFGVAPKTMQNNIATCQAWPHDQRVAGEFVRYKHHEALPASMSMDEKRVMLGNAEEGGWTWARLYATARGNLEPDGTGRDNVHLTENNFLGDVPVDELIANGRAQDIDELDALDEDGLDAVLDAIPQLDAQAVDLSTLPEGWEQYDTLKVTGEALAPFAQDVPDDAGDFWVSMAHLDNGTTTILTEGNPSNQVVQFLFSDGSTWQVIADTTLSTLRVQRID